MPTNYIPGFDPVAMGLKPIVQGGYTPASAETGEATDPGVQTGWYKYLGDRKQQQYDMDGNPTRVFENPGMGEQTLDLGKKLAPLALAALGANAFGGLATGVGDAGAGMGWMGGVDAGAGLVTAGETAALGASQVAALTPALPGSVPFLSYEASMATWVDGVTAGTMTAPAAATTAAAATIPEASMATWVDGVTAGTMTAPAATTGIMATIGEATTAVETWMKANPLLTSVIGATVGTIAKELSNEGDSASDVAKIKNQGEIDVLTEKERQELAKRTRMSDSITGLNTGLINTPQTPLKRANGSNVFTANGLINRG